MRRRRFLEAAAGAAAALGGAGVAKAQGAPVRFELLGGAPGPAVPDDFIGLSYECEQLENPAFFSADNRALVDAFRQIAPRGVLRLGGNTSEFSWWRERPNETPPPRRGSVTREGEPPATTSYAITPAAIDALAGFLRATGWRCLYGLNLGTEGPQSRAREAAYVRRTLGDRLALFAIGNEPDLFDRHLRDAATWNADRYFDEWIPAARGVEAVAPGVRFSVPEAASTPEWMTTTAERLSPSEVGVAVGAVSHHYYFGGPPANPKVNIGRLLQPDPKLAAAVALARGASARLGVRPRLTEANTCYRGGKPGVSDVFASALWSADLCLQLMEAGYEGAHLHGGSGRAVANSVGGHLEGDALVTGQAPRPRPFYTPIAEIGGALVLQPDAYGLRFAGLFAGSRMIGCRVQDAPPLLSVYAARSADGRTRVALVNKDASRPVAVSLPPRRTVAVLRGPALDSRTAELVLTSGAAASGGALGVPPAQALAVELAA